MGFQSISHLSCSQRNNKICRIITIAHVPKCLYLHLNLDIGITPSRRYCFIKPSRVMSTRIFIHLVHYVNINNNHFFFYYVYTVYNNISFAYNLWSFRHARGLESECWYITLLFSANNHLIPYKTQRTIILCIIVVFWHRNLI